MRSIHGTPRQTRGFLLIQETGSLPVSILPVVMSYVLRVCTLSADEFFYLVFGQSCGLRDHGDIHAHRE